MANQDPHGEAARKIAVAARRDAISTRLSSYVGDHSGRVDLILVMQAAADEYRRLSIST